MTILGPQNFSQALGCTSPDLWKSRGNSTYLFHIRKWKDDFFYSTFMLKTKAKLTRERRKKTICFLRSDTLSVLLMIRWDWNDTIITVEKKYIFSFSIVFSPSTSQNCYFQNCYIVSFIPYSCIWNANEIRQTWYFTLASPQHAQV